jgi:hypothetical protein
MRSVLAVLLLAAACGKAEYQQCETACRNYGSLQYWSEWEPKIAAEPAAERAQLRTRKAVELNDKLERGLPQCIQSCQIANNEDMNKCMIAAKTWAEASECAETEAAANE